MTAFAHSLAGQIQQCLVETFKTLHGLKLPTTGGQIVKFEMQFLIFS